MKKILLLFLIFLLNLVTYGQDVHFSQFYASPMTLNPALAGYIEGCVRVGANHKDQWGSFTKPYNTNSIYADAKWNNKALRKGNWFGVGIIAYNDMAGNGQMNTTRADIGLSYHKKLNPFRTTYFSVGFSGGIGQKSIDFNKLDFGSQWNGSEFDNNISNKEDYTGNSFIYFDMNAGALFSMKISKNINFNTGASLFNVTKHKESFYNDKSAKEMKFIIHAAGFIQSERNFIVEPAVYFTKQKDAMELTGGGNVAFKVLKDAVYAGIWYRLSGDITPVLGCYYKRIKVLVSYDYNISKLQPATNAKGGFEISLEYTMPCKKQGAETSKFKIVKCPSFNQ